MTDFQITPPPELVQQWWEDFNGAFCEAGFEAITTEVFRAAADQELEACCEWLVNKLTFREDGIRFAGELRAARRPKPPSLKARALQLVDLIGNKKQAANSGDWETIRRALEALPDE
jgi:hypothetical protein